MQETSPYRFFLSPFLYKKKKKILRQYEKSSEDNISKDLSTDTLTLLLLLLLLLLSHFSCVWLGVTPQTAAHQAPPSLGFSKQEHWSGLPLAPKERTVLKLKYIVAQGLRKARMRILTSCLKEPELL